jgi:hypothetical protein
MVIFVTILKSAPFEAITPILERLQAKKPYIFDISAM